MLKSSASRCDPSPVFCFRFPRYERRDKRPMGTSTANDIHIIFCCVTKSSSLYRSTDRLSLCLALQASSFQPFDFQDRACIFYFLGEEVIETNDTLIHQGSSKRRHLFRISLIKTLAIQPLFSLVVLESQ